jgi:hypothetical protein
MEVHIWIYVTTTISEEELINTDLHVYVPFFFIACPLDLQLPMQSVPITTDVASYTCRILFVCLS